MLMVLGLQAESAAVEQIPALRIQTAIENITSLVRPHHVGYATFWDGNKYVQCRRIGDGDLRCEAAGTRMQPSLEHVLTPERLGRLARRGWVFDPQFGNYTQTFAANMPVSQVAEAVLRTLAEAYDAELSGLETGTSWVADLPCPPRNGPSQNLAGIVSDAPEMLATAVLDCSYEADPILAMPADHSAEALIGLYGARVTGEIQRLRVNVSSSVFVIFDAQIGYVQCMPDALQPAIYCEAQSVESWPALAAVLTPERLSLLQAAGYADPGRTPNHWKNYSLDSFSDAGIAGEILTILHDVYGYTGATELEVLAQ
jgi:hypothetical protein